MVRHVVGVMTGTSIDGIDAALVRVDGAGLGMRATLVGHTSRGLGDLAHPLRDLASQTPMPAGAIAKLATGFAQLHADVIVGLLATHGLRPDFVAVHGQTVFHHPPTSWQLIDAAPIAARLGVPVVTGLRAADLAAGGRGAPITPLADWILFRAPGERRAIVNLGGFCNVTLLPPADAADAIEAIEGFDACACNQVLDAVARRTLGTPYDAEGRAARAGTRDRAAVDALRIVLETQRSARRSLGTGDEAEGWVRAHAERLAGPDLAASAVAAIAEHVGRTIGDACDRVIVAGGGCRNRALFDALRAAVGRRCDPSDALGMPCGARESAAIAVLGSLSADGVPVTLPRVTGCVSPAPVSGVWTGIHFTTIHRCDPSSSSGPCTSGPASPSRPSWPSPR